MRHSNGWKGLFQINASMCCLLICSPRMWKKTKKTKQARGEKYLYYLFAWEKFIDGTIILLLSVDEDDSDVILLLPYYSKENLEMKTTFPTTHLHSVFVCVSVWKRREAMEQWRTETVLHTATESKRIQ